MKKRVDRKFPSGLDYHATKGKTLKDDYGIGREGGEDYGSLPYTGIPGYMEHRRNMLDESSRITRGDVLKDLGFADRLVVKGLKTHGEQLKAAVQLYNLAIEEAERIGDYNLAEKIYNKANKKLSRAKLKVEMPNKGYKGFVDRLIMLGRVNESLGKLKSLERSLSVLFFIIAGLYLIFPFVPSITGSVIGGGNENFYGLIAFILSLIGMYFFFKQRKV